MANSDWNRIVFGAAGIGMSYGQAHPDGTQVSQPDEGKVRETIEAVWDCGVRIADTAPVYGESEALLGRYWRGAIWTKCGLNGLDSSLQHLCRNSVDAVQWHNWSPNLAEAREYLSWVSETLADSRVAMLGASMYDENDAKAATSEPFDLIQVPWNVMCTKPAEVASQAKGTAAKVVGRSVLLQGLLAGRLPPQNAQAGLPQLDHFFRLAAELDVQPAVLAIRAALDCDDLHYVIIGLDDPEQLSQVQQAVSMRSLSAEIRRSLGVLAGGPWTDPRTW